MISFWATADSPASTALQRRSRLLFPLACLLVAHLFLVVSLWLGCCHGKAVACAIGVGLESTQRRLPFRTHEIAPSDGRVSRIVVVLHGLRGSGAFTCDAVRKHGWGPRAGTLFVCPDAPTAHSSGKGFDWYPALGGFGKNTGGESEVLAPIRAGLAEVDAFLTVLLERNGLTDRDLVVAGVSQGAGVAAYVGLQRGCRAVLALLGVVNPRAALIPIPPTAGQALTDLAFVNGEKDRFVDLECLRARFSAWEPRVFATFPGVRHNLAATLGSLDATSFLDDVLA